LYKYVNVTIKWNRMFSWWFSMFYD